MKKLALKALVVGCVFVLLLGALAGCSSGKAPDAASKGGDAAVADAATDTNVAADAGGTSPAPDASDAHTVTFPRAYFLNAASSDDAVAQLEALGCADIADAGNGSYTATMSSDAYNQVVADLYDQVMQGVATVKDAGTYPNVAEVTYDDNFTSVQVKLSTDMPGLEDTYALSAIGVPAATYQQVAGLPVGCQVDLVLQNGTIQQTAVYPV